MKRNVQLTPFCVFFYRAGVIQPPRVLLSEIDQTTIVFLEQSKNINPSLFKLLFFYDVLEISSNTDGRELLCEYTSRDSLPHKNKRI